MIKSKIEWCDSTWNPVTGCLHTCEYCYARTMANRFKGCDIARDGQSDQKIITLPERLKVTRKSGSVLNAAYPYGFTPTLHEYRLNDPLKKGFGKTVFVCSTADLFGEWVPDEWILKVFDACKAAMNHRYLFLTKNPARYVALYKAGNLPEGDCFWYGSTMDRPMTDIFKSGIHNTFVSIEPILAPFPYPTNPAAMRDKWVIFGAETGNRAGKVVPERSWIEEYVVFCKASRIPVFMKNSMKPIWGEDIITQFPWEE